MSKGSHKYAHTIILTVSSDCTAAVDGPSLLTVFCMHFLQQANGTPLIRTTLQYIKRNKKDFKGNQKDVGMVEANKVSKQGKDCKGSYHCSMCHKQSKVYHCPT